MKWFGTFEDLLEVFEHNRFIYTKESDNRFRIGESYFTLYTTTGTLLIQRDVEAMKSIVRRLLKDDPRFLEG